MKQTSLANGHPTGSVAFQYQVNEKMTVGIAAFTPSALGSEWKDLFIGPYPGYGESPAYPDKDWSSDMFVLDIHPTIGYQLADWISVGAGIGIKYTSIKLQSPVLVPGVDPSTGDRLPLPGSHYFVDGILTGTGIGFGFNLGVLVHPTDYFHVGISYIGPTTVPIEGKVEQTVYLPAMTGLDNFYGEPDATADFPLPQEFSVGFALDMNDRLTVAFDANWTGWGDLDVITIEQDGIGPTGAPAEDSDLVLEWADTWRYNWGVSYQATDDLELLGGFYYDPTPIPDKTMRPTISDVANKKSVSLGFQYMLGQSFTVSGYYEHLFSFENDARARDNDGDGMFDNVPGTWKLNVDTIGVQFGYRF
ncbi:putative outer membrane protein precursor [bacterium BMS3Bbin04]|nr:putative outer membrane protein precursor [bacterium BMS3Bbin04]